MSSQNDPLYRIVGGSGTTADPHVLRSDLLNFIDRIPTGGYHYTPARIATARAMLARTELSEETRRRLEEKLLNKEYWWHSARPAYLVQLAMDQRLPARREDLLQQARQAEKNFHEFDNTHADFEVHPPRRKARNSVNQLIAMHEQRRREWQESHRQQ